MDTEGNKGNKRYRGGTEEAKDKEGNKGEKGYREVQRKQRIQRDTEE